MSMKELSPLVSVIMPTYNHGKYIGQAIQSVLDQIYQNIELIVIDNYSIDNTEEVVSAFSEARIKYYKFHNNGVIAASRNYGVQKANGEVLAFLDSDDLWLTHKLEKQLPHLADKKIIAVSSNFIPLDNNRHYFDYVSKMIKKTYRDFSYDELILMNPVITSSLIISKKHFMEVKGFDESHDFCFIEDWELWLRLCKEIGVIRVLQSHLIKYRIVESNDRDYRKVAMNCLKIIEKHRQLGYLSGKLLNYAQGNCFVNIGRACLDMNDYNGIKYYLRSLIYSKGVISKKRALWGLFLFIMRPFKNKIL